MRNKISSIDKLKTLEITPQKAGKIKGGQTEIVIISDVVDG